VPIECVVNVSEGRNEALLAELALTVAPVLLDRHTDADHHRSVFTLAGAPDHVSEAVRELAAACVGRLDLGSHQGAHPRLGVLDVVPFVPFAPGQPPSRDLGGVVSIRDEFAQWLSATFDLPIFLYGPLASGQSRALPQVRRMAFADLAPDFGPGRPHRTAGATAVGARAVLVAYNVWVSSAEVARRVAPLVRSSAVRALGLAVGDRAQVSCNLIDPARLGPVQLYDLVADLVTQAGGTVTGAELVGLIPQSILATVPASRWTELGLSASTTIESRLLS
jgi:glutamate formiminotransferase / 5-formyltetrahydrofolate cyclo-ligase